MSPSNQSAEKVFGEELPCITAGESNLPVSATSDNLALVWPVADGSEHGVSKDDLTAHKLAMGKGHVKQGGSLRKQCTGMYIWVNTNTRSQMIHVPSVLAVTHCAGEEE